MKEDSQFPAQVKGFSDSDALEGERRKEKWKKGQPDISQRSPFWANQQVHAITSILPTAVAQRGSLFEVQSS